MCVRVRMCVCVCARARLVTGFAAKSWSDPPSPLPPHPHPTTQTPVPTQALIGNKTLPASNHIFSGPPWVAPLIGIWEVMTALGLTMITAGVIAPLACAGGFVFRNDREGIEGKSATRTCRLASIALLVLSGVLCFVASNAVLVALQNDNPCGDPCPGNVTGSLAPPNTSAAAWPRFQAPATTPTQYLVRFLFIPGHFVDGAIVYPLVPWLGLTLAGMGAGYDYRARPKRAHRTAGVAGVAFLLLFVLIRFVGGPFGNLRGWPRGREGSTVPFISFMTICKYPPSIAYVLYTLGVVQCLIAAFNWLWNRCGDDSTRGGGSSQHAERDAASTLSTLSAPLGEEAPVARSDSGRPAGGVPRRSCSYFPEETTVASRCDARTRRVVQVVLEPFLVFGRTPLFFYVLHFWVRYSRILAVRIA